MEISQHTLKSDFADFEKTDKTSGTFNSGLPDTVVIHYTAGSNALSTIHTFKESGIQASAHVVVDSDGNLTQMVPFNEIAWHAGKSSWHDRSGLNRYSIGIEIVNAGKLVKSGDTYQSWFGRTYPEEEVIKAVHRNEDQPSYWHRYNEKQIDAVFNLCKTLMSAYDIRFILGHEEISPGRKIDPGPAFPLDKVRDRLLHADRKSDEEDEEDKPASKGIVNASALNIRSGPSTGTDKIAPPLSRNTELKILDEQNDWYQVEVKMRGWVSGKFVKKVNP
ncbi:MAG: N-acetylmuramoyl-L-alanine amidase [Balneolaceae bacterium]